MRKAFSLFFNRSKSSYFSRLRILGPVFNHNLNQMHSPTLDFLESPVSSGVFNTYLFFFLYPEKTKYEEVIKTVEASGTLSHSSARR